MVRSLTGIRGVAALWVLVYHAATLIYNSGLPGIDAIVSRGYLGVDVFFALSGFVLSHSNGNTALENLTSIRAFYLRRIVRIFPPHLAALALVLCAVLFIPGFKALKGDDFYRWSTLPANILLIQTWTIHTADWNGPAWSLSAEFLGYLLFPAMFFVCRRLTTASSMIALGMVMFVAVAFFIAIGGNNMAKAGLTGILRMAFSFTAGMLAFNIRTTRPTLVMVSAVAFLAAGIAIPHVQPIILLTTPLLLIALISREGSRVARFFASGPIYFLGQISFSLYIVQWVTIESSAALLPSVLFQPVVAFVLTAVLTLLFYRAVEVPSIGWSRSVGRHDTIQNSQVQMHVR